jgi:hypothetical protein
MAPSSGFITTHLDTRTAVASRKPLDVSEEHVSIFRFHNNALGYTYSIVRRKSIDVSEEHVSIFRVHNNALGYAYSSSPSKVNRRFEGKV